MKVIFACVHNAGRSQMAAAFFNASVDSKDVKVPDVRHDLCAWQPNRRTIENTVVAPALSKCSSFYASFTYRMTESNGARIGSNIQPSEVPL